MCYAEIKVIVVKTPAKACINKFCKTRNVCTTCKKLQLTSLGPVFSQC